MYLRDLSGGAISGTGAIDISQFQCTAIKVLVNTDNTNAALVVIRKSDANQKSDGAKLIDLSTKTAGDYPLQPVLVDGTKWIFYNISGTGATAQIFGYVL